MIARIKEEKTFVAVAGALFLVFLLWNSMMRGRLSESINAHQKELNSLRNKTEEFGRKGMASEEQLAQTAGVRRDLEDRLKRLSDRVRFTPDPRFKTPQNLRARDHFLNLRIKSKELEEQAMRKGVRLSPRIQQLNFNPTPASDEEAEEHLIRLDVVYRILETMFLLAGEPGLGVHRIEDIQPLTPLGAAAPGHPFSPGRCLNKVKVSIKFRATGTMAFRLAQELASPDVKKNRGGLAIEDFVVERPDPTSDQVDASLSVSALIVDLAKPLTEGP